MEADSPGRREKPSPRAALAPVSVEDTLANSEAVTAQLSETIPTTSDRAMERTLPGQVGRDRTLLLTFDGGEEAIASGPEHLEGDVEIAGLSGSEGSARDGEDGVETAEARLRGGHEQVEAEG